MKNRIILIIVSLLLFIGAVVCAICDLAISKTLTWSLIPISSIVFVWIILFPIISFGKKGICGSLIVLSISIIPYLYIVNSLIENNEMIFTIGSKMALIGIIYLWCIFALFKILKRRYRSLGISLLLTIPFCILINFILSKIIAEPIIDIWDIFTIIILIILSCIFLIIDSKKQKNV